MANHNDTCTVTVHEPVKFILKDLVATEERLYIHEGLNTMKDLIDHVRVYRGIPPYLQRYVCNGRDLYPHQTLEDALKGTKHSHNQDRIIWLLWMRHTDHICVYGGGMFMPEDRERKRQLHDARHTGRPFEAISLFAYSRLADRIILRHEQAQIQPSDGNTDPDRTSE